MKRPLIFMALSIYYFSLSTCFAMSYLTEEKITEAMILASTRMTCEEFRSVESKKEKNDRKDYFTLEKWDFDYKGKKQDLCLCVGMYNGSHWGEVAVYPGSVDPKKIKYDFGEFNDLGQATALYLSTIKFEYEPATDSHPAFIIYEKVNAGYKAGQGGYSQACTKYFLDEFVTKHTTVDFVFSDARNTICQHFFPRYGLIKGIPESFKTVKFARPLHVPFYWQRKK